MTSPSKPGDGRAKFSLGDDEEPQSCVDKIVPPGGPEWQDDLRRGLKGFLAKRFIPGEKAREELSHRVDQLSERLDRHIKEQEKMHVVLERKLDRMSVKMEDQLEETKKGVADARLDTIAIRSGIRVIIWMLPGVPVVMTSLWFLFNALK